MLTARELTLQTLRLEQDGRVLTAYCVTPPLNFATSGLLRDLDLLTRAVEHDPSVGAVVLTGGTEGRFLTHADPHELSIFGLPSPEVPAWLLEPAVRVQHLALRAPGLARTLERYGGPVGRAMVWGYRWKRTILRMNRSSTVYLAAINGPAMGGGHELALACDLRYAADADHVRLGQIETLISLIPGGGGTQRLPGMLGTARALEHMLEGTPLTAKQGFELGLVHRLVPDEHLIAETQATAARLARRPPASVRALKQAVYFATSRRLPRGLDYELAGFIAAGSSKKMKSAWPIFMRDLERHGDTPFLAETDPWVDGTKIEQAP